MHARAHHVCLVSEGSGDDVGTPGTGVLDSCEWEPCGCWERNLVHPGGGGQLLEVELSLSALVLGVKLKLLGLYDEPFYSPSHLCSLFINFSANTWTKHYC